MYFRIADFYRGPDYRWLDRLSAAWPHLGIESMDDAVSEIVLGKAVKVGIDVRLDVLMPNDVAVEIVTGRVNADGDITNLFTTPMLAHGQKSENIYRFEAEIHSGSHSGLYGYAIRVLPKHRDLVSPFLPGMILWECGGSVRKEAHYAAAR